MEGRRKAIPTNDERSEKNMKIPIFGKEFVIGEKDKHGKNIVVGVVDTKTGKGMGVYTDPEPVFER